MDSKRIHSDDSDYEGSFDLPNSISTDEARNVNKKKSKSKSSESTECTVDTKRVQKNSDKIKKRTLCFSILKGKHTTDNKKEKLRDRWIKLDDTWNRILLQDNNFPHFVTKDVLGDGNCQFRSVEKAFKNESIRSTIYDKDKITHKNLRRLIHDFIIEKLSDEEFNMILEAYKMEKDSGEFVGSWDPHKIKEKSKFARQAMKPGYHFQGDDITLMLLSRALNVDFIIFDQDHYTINQLSRLHPAIIILMYKKIGIINGGHYQVIGIKKNKSIVQTIFDRDFLPDVLEKILDKQKYLHEHIKKCYEHIHSNKFTLNNLYKYLKDEILKRKLRKSERELISNILEEYIKKIKVKKSKRPF